MNIDIADAYREACLALGESIVRERFLAAELERLVREPSSPAAPEATA